MIETRNWTAQNLGKCTALVSAVQGLSPFAMVDLIEEDVAAMQQASVDLANVVMALILDHKAARAKAVATMPVEANGFLVMLKKGIQTFYLYYSQFSV